MIRQQIIYALVDGPLTVEELSERLGIPRPVVRVALTAEFYRQVEVDHPEHGHCTAWALRPSALRVTSDGHYFVPGAEA